MDCSQSRILYASRRARKDTVVRAASDSAAGFETDGGEHDDYLGDDLRALVKHGDGESSKILPAVL